MLIVKKPSQSSIYDPRHIYSRWTNPCWPRISVPYDILPYKNPPLTMDSYYDDKSLSADQYKFKYLCTIKMICCDNGYCGCCGSLSHLYYDSQHYLFYLKYFHYDKHGPCGNPEHEQKLQQSDYILQSNQQLFIRNDPIVKFYLSNYQSRLTIQIAYQYLVDDLWFLRDLFYIIE